LKAAERLVGNEPRRNGKFLRNFNAIFRDNRRRVQLRRQMEEGCMTADCRGTKAEKIKANYS